ncbi:alcohol dehydrogenase [Caenibius sp. WL]|uniref:alcohol dehydrogenase n=1 Tax=Caenibius sp. WL TaxID=2872646 RepID=UPI001C99B2B5|nr:alcohol dehydrogenase [Caenibius sp. WL]QZP09231.1 alcohol dehydrogenase [Caenibius sp. WL]
MKSYQLVAFGAALEPNEKANPQPSGTEVLLRTRAAGVCHSDLHLCEGGYDLGGGKVLSLTDRGVRLPRTLGHETVGEVVAVGPDATGVAVGDIRLIYPWIGCGSCANCTAGSENLCLGAPANLGVHRDGGYADHILAPHPRYLLDLKGIEPTAAAPLACSGLTTYSALRKVMDVARRQPILLIGAGGLGLMCLALLKALGGKGAVVVDLDPAKREAALQAGALAVIDGAAPDAAAQINQALGTPLLAGIDFVGNPATAALGFDLLAKGGKMVIVGLFGGASPWSLPLFPMKALTVQGSYVGNLQELHELVDLVSTLPQTPLPIDARPLDQANQALDDLASGRVVGRAVLVP